MARRHPRGGPRWYLAVIVTALVAASIPLLMANAGPNRPLSSGSATAASASVGTAPAGRFVHAQTYPSAPIPTRRQQEEYRQGLKENLAPGPDAPISQGPFPKPVGPGMTPGTSGITASQLFRNTSLPAGGLRSAVDEPSTDGNGKNLFVTGNWYAAFSHNAGNATVPFTYLDPFTIFGSGYCCDQLAIYDVGHTRQFWLLQYGDHLTLANSGGSDMANWCYYNITPSWFGYDNATTGFDYNHIGLTTNFLYLSTDVYSSTSTNWSVVARLPIDPMRTCSGFSYGYFGTQDFAPAFVQGAGDTMYWGTNWAADITLGTQFRIRTWADNSNSIFTSTRNIDAYPFMSGNTGNCSSANGTVLNWCQRTDSRMAGGGYLAIPSASSGGLGAGNAIVGFAFNAKQDGGHPQPFIRRVYFRSSDLTYLGYSEIWCTVCAQLYPDMAPDRRGHVGIVWAWGGGTGANVYYPGSGYTVDDDVSPNQPWDYNFYQWGAGNACLNPGDNLRRWGDYLNVRPWHPSDTGWLGTGFALTSDAGSCTAPANVDVKNVVFGQARDLPAYGRWKKK
jgi:hypothetical protein